MYPSKFEIYRPRTIPEAIALLQEHGDAAKLIAGGHSLLPMMKLRLAAPEHLVDLSRISELRGIKVENGDLVIGAMSRHWDVQSSPLVKENLPFLSQIAGEIADPQVRNRGTMGGSLSHADPAADYPAAALALNARMICDGPNGSREIVADEWFVDLMTTVLEQDEVLKEIRIALPTASFRGGYVKHHHPASRFAMAGVAAALNIDEGGRCVQARIGITGVAMVAFRAKETENALIGAELGSLAFDRAAALADTGVEDVTPGFQMSSEGKRQLCRTITKRALEKAFSQEAH